MTDDTKLLSLAARRLSAAERLELVEQILDSLDRPDPALDARWAKEAEDRLDAYRRGELGSVSLSEVLAKYSAS